MPRPLVSIVMATYQRGHLLCRSLEAYQRSVGISPRDDLELVVVDDSSTDDTRSVIEEWSYETHIKSVTVTPHPKWEDWRDCGSCLNYGIRACSGEYIFITHPEVIPGRKSIVKCVEALAVCEKRRIETRPISYYMDRGLQIPMMGLYACCPVYYLSPRDQEHIDSVPWREKGNLALRELPGFYDEDENGQVDYTHRATDVVAQPGSRLPTWESWVFGGLSRKTWKAMGGMLVTQRWGSVDIAFMERRRSLGIPNHTTPDPDTIVAHQNHDLKDDVKTPRDMEAWQRELHTVNLRDPRGLCYPEIDELGW